MSPLTVAALLGAGGRAAGQAAERGGGAQAAGGHGGGGRDGADAGRGSLRPGAGRSPGSPRGAPRGLRKGMLGSRGGVRVAAACRPSDKAPGGRGPERSPFPPGGCCILGYIGVRDNRANPAWSQEQTHPGSSSAVKCHVEWGPGPIWPSTKSGCKTLREIWTKPPWNLTPKPQGSGTKLPQDPIPQ